MSENPSELIESTHVASPNGGIHLINFNTADPDELAMVPGVGPKIAGRIVAARPFEALSDLGRVSGIGPSLLERIKPFVSLDAVKDGPEAAVEEADDEAVDELQEEEPVEILSAGLLVEEDEELAEKAGDEFSELDATTEPADSDVESPNIDEEGEEAWPSTTDVEADSLEPETASIFAESADPQPAAEDAPRMMTRAQTFWLVVGSSFVAFALALVLSLAILAGINNGGLRFALPGEITSISRQIESLSGQAALLQTDLNGLRNRMDNLETLGGRMDSVEAATSGLASDLEATGQEITALNEQAAALGQQVAEVGEQVGALEGENEQFRTFFGGLTELLNQVFAPAEAP